VAGMPRPLGPVAPIMRRRRGVTTLLMGLGTLLAASTLLAPGLGSALAMGRSVPCPTDDPRFHCASSINGLVNATDQTEANIDAARKCLVSSCPTGYRLGDASFVAVGAGVTSAGTDPGFERVNATVYGCSSAGASVTVGSGTVPGHGFRLSGVGALGLLEVVFAHVARLFTFTFGLLPIIEVAPPEPPEEITLKSFTSHVAWGHKKTVGVQPLLYRVHADYLVVPVVMTGGRESAASVAVPGVNAFFAMMDGDEPRTVPIDDDSVMTTQEGQEKCGWNS
jgi:hypothetical protein